MNLCRFVNCFALLNHQKHLVNFRWEHLHFETTSWEAGIDSSSCGPLFSVVFLENFFWVLNKRHHRKAIHVGEFETADSCDTPRWSCPKAAVSSQGVVAYLKATLQAPVWGCGETTAGNPPSSKKKHEKTYGISPKNSGIPDTMVDFVGIRKCQFPMNFSSQKFQSHALCSCVMAIHGSDE